MVLKLSELNCESGNMKMVKLQKKSIFDGIINFGNLKVNNDLGWVLILQLAVQ